MATIATAYVQVMPSMEGATENITKTLTPQLDSAGSSIGAGFGGKLTTGIAVALKKFAAPAVIATSALAAGKALMDVGKEFDSMTDTIVTGTGASGDALDSLVNSAKTIATSVPASFDEAGDVVQNLNTRLGLTGDNLEQVGMRALAAGKLLGTGVNLDKLTGTMNTFGVSADDVAQKMDYLFNVGQATGIGFNDLTGAMETNAPVLKQLGFSFEESANMAGLLDKMGVNASSTMGKLTKVLKESADKGIPAREAYEGIVGQLQEFLAAGDEVSAMNLAEEVFGTRGSAQFLDALKSGALGLDEISNAALGAGDGIMGTMQRTEDWPEKWEKLQNKAKAALEPMGGALMDAASKGIDVLSGAFDKLTQFVDDNGAAFDALGAIITTIADVVIAVISAAFDVVSWVFGSVTDGINTFVTVVMPNMESGIRSAFDAIKGFISTLANAFNSFFGNISAAARAFADGVRSVFEGIQKAVSSVWEAIKTSTTDAWNAVSGAVTSVLDSVSSAIESAFSTISGFATSTWESISGTISSAWDAIESTVSGALGAVSSTISSVFDSILSTATNVWNGIQSAIEGPMEAAKNFVGGIIDTIKGFFDFNISWPHIPLPHINYSLIEVPLLGSIPDPTTLSVEWYARGGIVNAPTIIGAGESGSEAIVPLTRPNLEPFAEAVADEVGTDELIRWLSRNLGPIISAYAPSLTRREFERMARGSA